MKNPCTLRAALQEEYNINNCLALLLLLLRTNGDTKHRKTCGHTKTSVEIVEQKEPFLFYLTTPAKHMSMQNCWSVMLFIQHYDHRK